MITQLFVAGEHEHSFYGTEVHAAEQALAEVVGGFHRSAIGVGGWWDGEKVLREHSVIYTIVHATSLDDLSAVDWFVHQLKVALKQTSILRAHNHACTEEV